MSSLNQLSTATRRLALGAALGLAATLTIVLGLSPLALASPKTPGQSSPKPTIVLVNGAWANSASWNGVIERLQADGYTVYAPPNPLRSLQGDSDTIADFLKTISGPIVLVGHSYGGMVITNAANGIANVKALVYVDAFAPAQGESAFELTAKYPGSVALLRRRRRRSSGLFPTQAPRRVMTGLRQPCVLHEGLRQRLDREGGCGRGGHPEPGHAERGRGSVRTSGVGAHPELGRRGHDRQGDPRGGAIVHGHPGSRAHHRGPRGPSVHGVSARCRCQRHRIGRRGNHRSLTISLGNPCQTYLARVAQFFRATRR